MENLRLCAAGDSACATYQEISPSEVAAALDAGMSRLRFPGALEQVFETDSGGRRADLLIARGIPSLVLFNLFLLYDYIALPDVFLLAVTLRLALVTIAGFATIWVLSTASAPAVREGLMALVAVAAAGILLVLMAKSHSPYRDNYHYGMVPVLMFAAMVQRVRFKFVLAASITIVGLHLAAVLISGMTWVNQVGAVTMMVSTALLSLFAGYSLEREERLSWLLSLRERLRSVRFEEMSTIDPLTGLGNRRALDRALAGLRQTGGSGQVLALALADIDYFKTYNDAYGHLAGDECLRRVAKLLVKEAGKQGGTVFRFGGEEFVILLPAVDAETALRSCEKLRFVVDDAGIAQQGPNHTGRVTISIGVAVMRPEQGDNPDTLIFQADTALYQAKGSGRNQVVMSAYADLDKVRKAS